MTLVKNEVVERNLAAVGDVVADKGFQGSGYITPVKKPKEGAGAWRQLGEQGTHFVLDAEVRGGGVPSGEPGVGVCRGAGDEPSLRDVAGASEFDH